MEIKRTKERELECKIQQAMRDKDFYLAFSLAKQVDEIKNNGRNISK